ncbi:MAG: hypothetical protein GY940_38260 [bacterium]|nr:hypothetical protein [bacterium]
MKESVHPVLTVFFKFLFTVSVVLLFLFFIPPLPAEAQEGDAGSKFKGYTFTLAPGKEDRPDEYSRDEIESFLCGMVEAYIDSRGVVRVPPDNTYMVRPKINAENQQETAYRAEITKWFENRVTVTTSGKFTFLDIGAIKRFYRKVNEIIGREKFVYLPDLEVANIVIQLAVPDPSGKVEQFIGETSILHDNLRARMGIDESEIRIDTYKSGGGLFINSSRKITYSEKELEFRKKHRLVKVLLQNILDPGVRHFALVHELLHSIGFSGHSPYHESHLFPLPVQAYENSQPGLKTGGKIMTPMAERMVEMLYRPEILPGMTVKEAAMLLTGLKFRAKTPKPQIKTYFLNKTKELDLEQNRLLQKGKENYDRRMGIYLRLDRVVRKEEALLAELREIKTDNKLPAGLVDELKNAKSLEDKLIRIRRELILLETKKNRLEENRNTGGKRTPKVRKQIKLIEEESVVLKDIIAVAQEVSVFEQKLEATRTTGNRKELEEKLRRVLRQSIVIKEELSRLDS